MFISRAELEKLQARIAKLEVDAYVRVLNGGEPVVWSGMHMKSPKYEKVTISEIVQLLGVELEWDNGSMPHAKLKAKRKRGAQSE